METVFSTTSNQMIGLFIIMFIGYIGNKKHLLAEGTDTILSRLLSNIIMPALVFQTFSRNFTVTMLREKIYYVLTGVAVLAVSMLIAWIFTRFFAKDSYGKKIYFYSLTIANLGYMGYSVAGPVFGEATLLNMMIFTIPFQAYIYSFGVSLLNPNNRKISFRSLLNPVFTFMVLGILAGLLNLSLPKVLTDTISGISGCMSPCAMILTGYVVAKYNLKAMLLNGRIYLASLTRLLATPCLIGGVMALLGMPKELICVALCTTAMPMGLNTVVFPAAYGAETKTGASMALISNLLALGTIPIVFAIFLG